MIKTNKMQVIDLDSFRKRKMDLLEDSDDDEEDEEDINNRINRIKSSIGKINQLMMELRGIDRT